MRRSALPLLSAVAVVPTLVFAAGCSSCQRSEAVATVAEETGTIDRDTKTTVGKWTGAPIHAELFVGDGIRSGKQSKAVLELSDQNKLDLAENTIIRFRDRASGSKKDHIDLEAGEAVLEVAGTPLSLETDVGLAVINAGSRISLKRTDQGIHYEVSVGLARFDKGGQTTEVKAGEGVTIGVGNATIEKDPPPAPPAPSAAAPEPAPAAPEPAGGSVTAHVVGGGASVRAPGEKTFAKLSGDSTIAAGSTVRLASGSSADVDRGGEHATLHGSGDFVVAEAGQSFVQARGGSVSFSSTTRETTLAVPGGSIVVKTGATADVHVKADSTQVAVKAGVVELHSESGTEQLQAGEQGTIGAKGVTEVIGRGPGYVDFATSPGASFAVHDPSPPTAIGFATSGPCPEGAVIELDKGRARARGTGTFSILFPAGAHHYDIHCVDASGVRTESAASGSIAVIHDAGTARIPRTAPSTLVDTDGRNYTVMYQNILPKISVRWPNAPQGSSYNVTLAGPGGKTESHATSSPSYSFPSGALREGLYRLTFEGGGKSSKPTTVDIRFDNAAPTATLTSPANGSFAQGGGVNVSGLALEGWKISVAGRELPLDGQLRFSGDVTAPAGERALAVLFENPHRGVHYYLRRSAGH